MIKIDLPMMSVDRDEARCLIMPASSRVPIEMSRRRLKCIQRENNLDNKSIHDKPQGRGIRRHAVVTWVPR